MTWLADGWWALYTSLGKEASVSEPARQGRRAVGTVISFRLAGDRLERLRRVARAMNRTPGEAAAALVEEGVRLREFPGIEFRDTPVGRQPYLSGTRLGLWQVVPVARAYGGDVAEAAAHLGIGQHEVALALAYERAYPDEIAAVIADLSAANERVAALIASALPDSTAE